MQPQIQLKNKTTAWNSKARYRVRDVVSYNGNYWVNSTGINTEPVSGSPNWILFGSVNPTTVAGGNNLWKYIIITSDSNEIQDNDFIGATDVKMMQSTVSGTQMKSQLNFNTLTGTIENYDVFIGDEFMVFYTKP